MELIAQIMSLFAVVVGATWVLSNRLASIETAIKGHVQLDEVTHRDLMSRVVKLEDRRKRGSK